MRTSVRFSLRNLCTVVLVFAVLFAMLSPIVRAWKTEWQTFFLAYGAAILGGMGVVTMVMCRARFRLEQQAGRLLLRTDARPDRRMRVKQGIWLALWLVLIVGQWWLAATTKGKPQAFDLYPMFIMGGFWGIFLIPHALTKVWWGTAVSTIEICENGLIMAGSRLIRWETVRRDLRRFYWSPFAANRLVIVHRFSTWQIEVAPTDRAAVDQLFAAHIGNQAATSGA